MARPSSKAEPQLARLIGLPLLTFYGLGTILGAGIYVLVGKVAATAGMLAPLAFLAAALVAVITGLSFCQLVVRYPQSAGEARYVEEGFHRAWLTILVGYLVVFNGTVSAATLANGFVGYFSTFSQLEPQLALVLVVLVMGGIALWGIAESLWLTAVITVVEISGLILVVALGGDALEQLPERLNELFLPTSWMALTGVISGAFLAFYAFIGFEDMVNVVEEVKQPSKIMPKAIILAVVLSSILYLLVAAVAVLGLPISELAASEAPLRDLIAVNYPQAGSWIGVISLFAIVNGILIQIIMASRILYGMAMQQRAPMVFAKVSRLTKTPWISTLIVTSLVLAAGLWLPLVSLAKATSFVTLVVFVLVNITLWILVRRGEINPNTGMPSWPLLGAVLCAELLAFQIYSVLSG